jgi:Gram-negative porin
MQSRITPSRPWRTSYELNAIILVALLWYPAAAPAAAEDPGASMFSVSAFGTLGVVHSSEDNADFTASSEQPNGAGYSHSWSPDVDSRLGAQATAHFTPQLSAMLQVISEQLYDKTFKPHVEWANITYQPTPEFSVRLGRIVLPTFLISDSRKVGYANPWVRPPVELYALSPVFDSDGADVNYQMQVGKLVNTLVGTYGNTHFGTPGGGELDAKRLWVIADTVEYGPLTLHIAYQQSSYTFHFLDPLFDAFRQFGPQGAALADKYDLDNKSAQLITAGAMYDPGKWFVTGEWAKRNMHSAIVESTAWYLSGGYRLAKFTPYMTYAKVKADGNTSDPGLNVSALPPFLAGPANGLNAGLNTTLGMTAVQNTISVGSRWDFMKNTDLKLQYDHIDLGSGSAGTLVNVQPGFQPGGTVNLFSIAIDFVW